MSKPTNEQVYHHMHQLILHQPTQREKQLFNKSNGARSMRITISITATEVELQNHVSTIFTR